MFETTNKMFQIFRSVNTRKAQSLTTLLKVSVSHKHNKCFKNKNKCMPNPPMNTRQPFKDIKMVNSIYSCSSNHITYNTNKTKLNYTYLNSCLSRLIVNQ